MEDLSDSSIMNISSIIQSAYTQCLVFGTPSVFTFDKYLKIDWDETNPDIDGLDLYNTIFKSAEDSINERITLEFLKDRYPKLIVDDYGEDYRLFFNERDFCDFDSWCKTSVKYAIECYVPEEVLRDVDHYQGFVRVRLFDVHVYRHIFRMMKAMQQRRLSNQSFFVSYYVKPASTVLTFKP